MSDPWSDIAASLQAGTDNLRRVSAEHPLEFWWGRDHSSRCLLALDYEITTSCPQFPELAGLQIVNFARDAAIGRLVLLLIDEADRDIFLALCKDLLAATSGLTRGDSQTGVCIAIARLVRWRELFRNRRERLSFERIIGLAGELLFLRDCLCLRVDPAIAVAMWRGPYGDEQDFVVGSTIFEVKTQLSTADAALHISSENQLDTVSGAVVIVHQLLGPAALHMATAFSLNGLAADLRRIVLASSPDAADTFDAGLLAAGYAPLAAYDEPVWMLVRQDMYTVEEAFPRIVPSMLPPGIEKVRYRLRVDACLPFKVDVTKTLEALVDE
ncbi:PD-(D/E)XK motif protein [Kaistia terrae]|uniref:PD-(D/E)XK motif protein n=1 Tax=Kaistia terrae TaxID=537017 RepID=A0ABW0Q0C3_9HYPH|nr:PD-(D/E)XK motif protein [Kaistia terrae]MCX5578991.1 PD-(D/E)XK motif protein [Kaistia terrae]